MTKQYHCIMLVKDGEQRATPTRRAPKPVVLPLGISDRLECLSFARLIHCPTACDAESHSISSGPVDDSLQTWFPRISLTKLFVANDTPIFANNQLGRRLRFPANWLLGPVGYRTSGAASCYQNCILLSHVSGISGVKRGLSV